MRDRRVKCLDLMFQRHVRLDWTLTWAGIGGLAARVALCDFQRGNDVGEREGGRRTDLIVSDWLEGECGPVMEYSVALCGE